ncbi:hypothetical protein A3C87_02350 [Candidatus Kaiserbacteria bacterium RIFCSPHIGHO2_02_FULL_49_34]|uniref:Uncharacterized protein n=1 Tax=Candidatus Kaiserbacteria bacterium RIFCSPHIGHO2_02_FULL_49_34 TaxID=1798491 RepID=A0A1F6DM07_9BACT|nr:MAG: hypothetical protein A3C87_02350 [Candidatus Kaiserbacteria bacterium RIFCSPHIGHO2_02_FULL_49_34]
MKRIQEKGSALTLIIVGTFIFFAVLGAVLWYVFSFAPEQRRQEGIQATQIIRAQEEERGIVSTPLGGDMSVCTKRDGEYLVRYYSDGIRVRLAELTVEHMRVSIWDGELLARYDANGSKKWFKVPDDAVPSFHTTIKTLEADTTFECIKTSFSANHFKRIDDPLVLEE